MATPATIAESLEDADERGLRARLGRVWRTGSLFEERARRAGAFATAFGDSGDGGRGISRFTCDASLSSRKPSNDAWRTRPSCVHSAKLISATSLGRTQWTSRASRPLGGSTM